MNGTRRGDPSIRLGAVALALASLECCSSHSRPGPMRDRRQQHFERDPVGTGTARSSGSPGPEIRRSLHEDRSSVTGNCSPMFRSARRPEPFVWLQPIRRQREFAGWHVSPPTRHLQLRLQATCYVQMNSDVTVTGRSTRSRASGAVIRQGSAANALGDEHACRINCTRPPMSIAPTASRQKPARLDRVAPAGTTRRFGPAARTMRVRRSVEPCLHAERDPAAVRTADLTRRLHSHGQRHGYAASRQHPPGISCGQGTRDVLGELASPSSLADRDADSATLPAGWVVRHLGTNPTCTVTVTAVERSANFTGPRPGDRDTGTGGLLAAEAFRVLRSPFRSAGRQRQDPAAARGTNCIEAVQQRRRGPASSR